MPRIYFDHNSTSPLNIKVQEAMLEVLPVIGNPSSVHWAGRQAKRYLNEAREFMAGYFGRTEREIIFTSGGSESINLALKGVWAARENNNKIKFITSPIEHHATLRCLEDLKDQGAEIDFLSVDQKGCFSLEELESKLDESTLLVSLMWVNNELGNISHIEKIAELCKQHSVLFHCDAVQGVGKLDVKSLEKVDLFSISAHKFQGPRGGGVLSLRDGLSLHPQIFGGRQERSLRAGTENLASIWGMKSALEKSDINTLQIKQLRDVFESSLLAEIPELRVNGDLEHRLFNTSNILFPHIDGESLLLNLDMAGLAASAGAACESGSIDPSHVLKALGFSDRDAKASLRFSFAKQNTLAEVNEAVEIIKNIVSHLRFHNAP